MKTKDELIANLANLTPLEHRSLNRCYLHPHNQRCCYGCKQIFDDYPKYFHIHKYYPDGTVAYNTKCATCYCAINRARTSKYREVPEIFIKSKLSSYQSRARFENSPFNLTSEALIEQWQRQGGICFYTGKTIDFKLVTPNGKAPHNDTPSLDRMDPNKGYTLGNVVWCSYAINRMKNEFTYDQFVEMCSHISTFRKTHDA